jgi:hypothetical protein
VVISIIIKAPIVETYTSLEYGRRKTWIVLSCSAMSLMIFGMSFFTTE